MLGWFKKKFGKKDTDETAASPTDLKIPVAPRPLPEPADDSEARPTVIDVASPARQTADATAEEPVTEEPLPETGTKKHPAAAPTDEEPDRPLDTVSEPETALPAEDHEIILPDESTTVELVPESPGTAEQKPATETPAEAVENATLSAEVEQEPNSEQDEQERFTAEIEAAETEIPTETPLPQPASLTRNREEPPAVPKKKSFLSKLSERLSRTRESFTYQLDSLFLGKKVIDAKLLDDLEELLITADLGLNVTQEVLDHARKRVKRKELSDPNSLKLALKEKLTSFIVEYQQDATLVMPDEGPFVIMVVGVNGVGKTTTIGKIAHKFLRSGQSVLLVAADTFRAAAVSQLKIWGERNKVQVIAKEEGADPSAVVYDGIAHAKAKGYDVVLVDTAGRLHTQANLMEELKKIQRVMGKQLEGAPHEVMLVLDATTGQNGISQAKLFNEAVPLTGITLTKLDGTAKGGIVINICRELKMPIRFIGVGEQLDDLRDFDPEEFIEALFHSAATTKKP